MIFVIEINDSYVGVADMRKYIINLAKMIFGLFHTLLEN